jgi:hypothetical protein
MERVPPVGGSGSHKIQRREQHVDAVHHLTIREQSPRRYGIGVQRIPVVRERREPHL